MTSSRAFLQDKLARVSRPRLGVVIPAYNEEPRIEATLHRLSEYLQEKEGEGWSWAVLVVSDGSTDRTVEIVEEFAQRDPRFHVHAYRPNRGKGCAVRTGMMLLDAEWLLLCDADLATPIEEVEKLFAAGTPVAIGSRALDRKLLEARQPFYREWAGRAFNKAVQLLGVPGLKDTQCGFKLFRGDVAKRVFSRCRLDSYGYDFEALMLARAFGYEIAEVPVRWRHQEGSKVKLLRDGFRMLWDLLLLRLTFRSRLRETE